MLLLTGLVAGCVTMTRAPDPLEEPPKANESAVVVSVTGNTTQIASIDSIELTRVSPAESGVTENFFLRRKGLNLSRDTTLFIGVLPAGEYEFSTMRDSQTQQHLNLSQGMRRIIGRFVVRDGKPADLGRLILTPVNFGVVVGRSTRVATNTPILERFAPEYASIFTRSTSSAWVSGRLPEDRVEEYAMERPVGVNDPRELSDGTIAAGTRLGTVLLRRPDGRWSAVRSDGLESLLNVMPANLPNAKLLAVGEFGAMLRLDPASKRLVQIDRGNLPPGNLLFIGGDNKAGWYLAHQRGSEVTLFRSPVLEAGQWTAIRTASVQGNFWTGTSSFWIWNTARGLAFATSEGGIHWLDFETTTWKTSKAPDDRRISGVSPNPNGSLGILAAGSSGLGGVFASLLVSGDEGQTWQEIKTEFNVKLSPPYKTRQGKLFAMGGFGRPDVHASSDSGKTWERMSEFQLGDSLVVFPSGRLWAVSQARIGVFDIRSSTDGGKTWAIDYTNFDRAAYEAKKAKTP